MQLGTSLLPILDSDPSSKWYVSQYYSGGTLDEHKDLFAGDLPGALKALRPLVAGVAELHKNGIVHRDIKPQNVFLDAEGNLILGDFGLVYFSDDDGNRLSDTWENVGSRDWMPPWAMGVRIEEIKPSFDVYCLGKLLWSMVSGKPHLQLWYLLKPRFNVEQLFPEGKSIALANPLLQKCVVENEEDCLPDATSLLERIDTAVAMIDYGADLVKPNAERRCKVCGVGIYKLNVDRRPIPTNNFGLKPAGTNSFKIFLCDHCGHVQLFAFPNGQSLPAWQV